jgi:hypothetical protein
MATPSDLGDGLVTTSCRAGTEASPGNRGRARGPAKRRSSKRNVTIPVEIVTIERGDVAELSLEALPETTANFHK